MKTAIEIAMEERVVDGIVTSSEFSGHPSIGSVYWLTINTPHGVFREVAHKIPNLPRGTEKYPYVGSKVRCYFGANSRGEVKPHRIEFLGEG